MFRFLFRPVWLLFHAVVVCGIVLMISLSLWQLRRLDERKVFNNLLIERSEQTPVPLDELIAEVASGSLQPAAVEWRRVTSTGTYLPEQLVEFNNFQNGRSGENVLSALVLDGDTTAIVNRGFVPLGSDVPSAPKQVVEIIGYVRLSEVRGRGGVTDAADGGPLTEVRRIDIPKIAAQLPGDVAPFYVQLIASRPEIAASDPQPVVLPEPGNGPHLSYAIQWIVFALCVAIGWVLAVRRSLRQRRQISAEPVPGAAGSISRAGDATSNRLAGTSKP
jgi:cytochrome oxidase assembly protein ShyY1